MVCGYGGRIEYVNWDWKKGKIGVVGMDALYYLILGFFFDCFDCYHN